MKSSRTPEDGSLHCPVNDLLVIRATSLFMHSQGSVFRGGPGPGEADRPDVCGEVHP